MNANLHQKTIWLYWSLLAFLGASALAILCWQQQQLTKQRQKMESLSAENSRISGLGEELARLKRLEVDHHELTRLRQAQMDGQREVARLRAKVADANRAEAADVPPPSAAVIPAAGMPDTNNAIAAPMAEMVKGTLEHVWQRRLMRMREKLNLSPTQSQALQEILASQYRGVAEAMQEIHAGKIDRQKLAEIRGNRGNPDDQIRALLSPEQLTAYGVMKEEDVMNNARLAANGELIQMQNTLALTSDQADKVFAILYDQIHHQFKEESAGNAPSSPAEALRTRQARQLAALEEVLTPSQLQGYRAEQENQIRFMEKMAARLASPSSP